MTAYSRRNFLKTSLIGGVAATFINPFDTFASMGQQDQFPASQQIDFRIWLTCVDFIRCQQD